ncbi:YigZ family protein [Rurimicrobium arvi]|uniref:IMPACT family protein n=1 Tax=Rurimicrobium arvi TaxID=2049916 RepID=A0ABP8MUF2_9BACT
MKSEAGKFTTIAAGSESLFKDRGSKFLAYAYPVTEVLQVKQHLEALRKEHPKAVHFCFAYRLGTDGLSFRSSDDGEPSGSAGKPILGQIDSAGLTDVLVVVVRYFGGTLLGVPGLIQAYKTATAEALALAPRLSEWICRKASVSTDYQSVGEVLYLLRQYEAKILAQDMQLFCTITCAIPLQHFDACSAQLEKIRGVEVKALS